MALVVLLGGIPWISSRLVTWAAFLPQPGVQVDPAAFGIPIESVFLRTGDGVRIHGFYLPRESASRAILFLHGNAGNASHRLPDAVQLWSLGANVLLLDYRGYGLSEGHPTEHGVYRDGEAGLAHLVGELGFTERDIVIFGRSIGSAVAVHIAQDRDLGGLVLVSPLTSGRDVARSQGLGWAVPLIGDPFNSAAKVANVRSPVIVIHGERDRIISPSMGKELHERAPDGRGFFPVPGAGHNDLTAPPADRFFGHVAEFLLELGMEPTGPN